MVRVIASWNTQCNDVVETAKPDEVDCKLLDFHDFCKATTVTQHVLIPSDQGTTASMYPHW